MAKTKTKTTKKTASKKTATKAKPESKRPTKKTTEKAKATLPPWRSGDNRVLDTNEIWFIINTNETPPTLVETRLRQVNDMPEEAIFVDTDEETAFNFNRKQTRLFVWSKQEAASKARLAEGIKQLSRIAEILAMDLLETKWS